MITYSRGSFSLKDYKNNYYREYFVCSEDPEVHLKPWAIFAWDFETRTFQQVSKWYCYRGWAERTIRQMYREKQKLYPELISKQAF